MLPSFSNLSQFEAYLRTALRKGMAEVGEHVEEQVKRRIDLDVYGAGTPSVYDRTYDLRNSVTSRSPKRTAKGISVKIEHDINQIRSYPDRFIHGSRYWSPNMYNRYIPETVHHGKSGSLFGDGFWRDRRPYMHNAVRDILRSQSHVQILKRSLREMGIDVL